MYPCFGIRGVGVKPMVYEVVTLAVGMAITVASKWCVLTFSFRITSTMLRPRDKVRPRRGKLSTSLKKDKHLQTSSSTPHLLLTHPPFPHSHLSLLSTIIHVLFYLLFVALGNHEAIICTSPVQLCTKHEPSSKTPTKGILAQVCYLLRFQTSL